MFVSSTINPSARSSTHFFIVHHNDERVLVPVDLHAKYADLQAFAVKEWGLALGGLVFETNELNICAGKLVRIHEDAWAGIRDVVGNVYVRAHVSNLNVQKGKFLLRFYNIASFLDYLYSCNARTGASASSIKYSKRKESKGAREHTESADEDEVEQQTRSDSQRSDYVVVAPAQNGAIIHPGPPSSPSTAKVTRKAEDPLKLFSDELSEKADGPDEEEEEGPKKPASKRVERTPSETHVARILRQEDSEQSTTTSKSSTKTTVSSADASRPTDVASHNPHSASTATNSSGSGMDSERVLIIVEAPDSTEEPRGFRIKREHTVQTVLKGASNVFKIDFTKARLRMVVDEEDRESHTIKCYKGDTMNSLGIEDGRRFIIEVQDSDEEEEEEESDN
ncbi:hypothetical protein M0805_002502 [Coniferiporia weirii]|nr:hypothetical protein M0805_002502 [Coniferiporia weirii]